MEEKVEVASDPETLWRLELTINADGVLLHDGNFRVGRNLPRIDLSEASIALVSQSIGGLAQEHLLSWRENWEEYDRRVEGGS